MPKKQLIKRQTRARLTFDRLGSAGSLSSIVSGQGSSSLFNSERVELASSKMHTLSLLEQNDSLEVELVHNALLKGFQNALRLTHKQRTLNDISKTWVRFLDLADMGLVNVFENVFDKGDSIELVRLHKDVERLANGGV